MKMEACPLCGSKSPLISRYYNKHNWSLSCKNECKIMLFGITYEFHGTIKEAKEYWNKRCKEYPDTFGVFKDLRKERNK
jgi:hypothetical protein